MPSFTRATYSKKAIEAGNTSVLSAFLGRADDAQAKAPMGLGRTVSSAMAIILGLTFCYAGLHYIPTALRPNLVVDHVASPSGKSKLDMDRNQLKRFGVFAQSFLLRRTYIKAGQGLTVYYTLPQDASLDLHIKQCRRMFIAEVYHCTPVSQQSVRIENKRNGARTIKFAEPGFYHFSETVNVTGADQKYRIVWTRK